MNINRIKQSNILVSTNPSSSLQSPSLFEKEEMCCDARIKQKNVCNKAMSNDWSLQDNLATLTSEFISSKSNLHHSSLQESRSVLPSWKEAQTFDPSLESNSLETIHSLLLDKGQMYERKQDYPRAIDSYEKSKSVALSILTNYTRNTLPLALSLKAIGDIYEKQSLYEFALQYYTAAIPYYSKSDGTFQLLGYTYKNIAFINGYKMNNLKKSTQFYNNAMKIFQLCHGMEHEITQRCLLDTKEVEKYHRLQKNCGMKKNRSTRRRVTRRGGRRSENKKAIYIRNE
ncbi:predicted protein [Chaetoceros tenuissimus]|uniref:Tetratricopeptide repeat protein n=1 Tax=Chaetoceros tenuissimus TaxID=426638 RepID=A0AAD3H249_9STRA|nr:predicted protein [Chaetoceros tenuissimus]